MEVFTIHLDFVSLCCDTVVVYDTIRLFPMLALDFYPALYTKIVTSLLQFSQIDEFFAAGGPRKLMFFYQEIVS